MSHTTATDGESPYNISRMFDTKQAILLTHEEVGERIQASASQETIYSTPDFDVIEVIDFKGEQSHIVQGAFTGCGLMFRTIKAPNPSEGEFLDRLSKHLVQTVKAESLALSAAVVTVASLLPAIIEIPPLF